MSRATRLPMLLCLCVGSAAAAPAPESTEAPARYQPPDYIQRSPALPPSFAGRRPRPVSRREVVERAVARNLDVSLQRERAIELDTWRLSALSAFAPTLSLGASRSTSLQPPASAQEGAAGQVLPNTYDQWGLSLSGSAPTGTALRLDFQSSRTDSALGTAVAPVIFRSSLLLTVTQPLLQGVSLRGRVQLAPLLRAEFNSEDARDDARLRAMQIVKQTEDAYWDLVESYKAYEVRVGGLDLARRQLDLTRRRIDAGVVSESELPGAELNLAQAQRDALEAEVQIQEAADALRRLMNAPPEEWGDALLPRDSPGFAPVDAGYEAALERALRLRPELRKMERDQKRQGLEIEVARNQRLPLLNLQGAIGTVGQDPGYDRALQQVGEHAGWQGNIGLNLQWEPLGLGARALLQRRLSLARQSRLNQEQARLQIQVDLRRALRGLEAAGRRLGAAVRVRDLASRVLDIEVRRFQSGLASDNQKIGLRQVELAGAQLAELRALIQHEKARAELDLATGELLEARHIRFELRGAAQ